MGAFLQAGVLRTGVGYRPIFAGALLGHCVGFYWMLGAIQGYSGLSTLASLAIFLGFMVLGAAQFPLLAWLYRHLPQRGALGMALANLVVECLGLRILPWYFGHSQLPLPLAQVADVGGAMLVSFALMWGAEAAYRSLVERERLVLPYLAVALAVGYGLTRPVPPSGDLPLTLVQGNHGDLAHYTELSRGRPGLVIWPESAVLEPVPDGLRHRSEEPRLPAQTLLLGAYTWDAGHHIYNAALALMPDGRVPPPYHKQILLPFAEYSWLAPVQLSAGQSPGVFDYPGVRVAPLICYEDALPGPARAAVASGAQLLVNLANDSWFGPLGARQHHQLACFRAIENRRFLARVTNSGLTALVDPRGVTLAELPQGGAGVLEVRAAPCDGRTLYNRWGDRPLQAVALIALLLALREGRRRAAAKARPPIREEERNQL